MSTKAVFTMKLEPELRDEFMAATAEDDRPASQVVRAYEDYVREKVETARASMQAGQSRSNDEVEATFSAKRRQIMAGQA